MLRRIINRVLRKCSFKQIGFADDANYKTLLVIKCKTCGVERYVRPNEEIGRCE